MRYPPFSLISLSPINCLLLEKMAQIPFKFKGLVCCFMQKRFLGTSALLTKSPTLSSSSSFTVQYLINSCGLPPETALSTSNTLQLDQTNPQKHKSVLIFLKSQGFTDTHIAKLIGKCPKILLSRVDGTLRPKINCLIENGFSDSLLPELIVANPVILRRSLSSQLKPSLDFLKTYLLCNEKVVASIKRSSWLLSSDLKRTLQPNINFLTSEGVPISCISKLIIKYPRAIMTKVDRMVHAVNFAKQLGIQPNAPLFVDAVRVMVSMSDSTWNRKVELFNSLLGWSEEDVKSAFKRAPICLASSEEKIKNVKEFFINTMKLEAAALLSNPKFFMYSINKRMRPRYTVLKILESKKLLKDNTKFKWALTQSENDFINNYVIKYLDQVPNIMELYRGTDTIPASKTGL